MSIAEQDASRSQWDATNFAAKDNLLRVVREEAETRWPSPQTSEHKHSAVPPQDELIARLREDFARAMKFAGLFFRI